MQKSERDIERRLCKEVKALGGWCLKFVSPGVSGVPDRIILLPGGNIVFAELKAPNKRERKLQLYIQDKIRSFGFIVIPTVDSYERVDYVIRRCQEEMMFR